MGIDRSYLFEQYSGRGSAFAICADHRRKEIQDRD